MAEEMKGSIISELRRGPKTDEELRRVLLGERPQHDKKPIREFDTRYQAFRRALEDLVSKAVVAEGRYRLRGGLVDKQYLLQLLKRYSNIEDEGRLLVIVKDVEMECGKVGAASIPELLTFLERMLNHSNSEIRKTALVSLRNLATELDDDRTEDRKPFRDMTEKFTPAISRLVTKDQPPLVRVEAIQLLAELGAPESIDLLAKIIKTDPEPDFKNIYGPLKTALCYKFDEYAFSKNRLKRDYKMAIHEVLLNLTQEKDPTIRKRADALIWHFRTDGLSHYPGGEPY
jgi:hypothetical protein